MKHTLLALALLVSTAAWGDDWPVRGNKALQPETLPPINLSPVQGGLGLMPLAEPPAAPAPAPAEVPAPSSQDDSAVR